MDTTALIVEAASTAGIAGSAMPDVLARSSAHFSAKEVTSESVQQFLTELRDTAPHLFAPIPPGPGTTPGALPPDWMTNPAERLTWARQRGPAPVKQKAQPPVMTPARQAAFEAEKSPVARLGKYYEWQAEDAKKPPAPGASDV